MTDQEFLDSFMSKKRSFGMYTAKGNRRVQALVKKCLKKILNGKVITMEDYSEFVSEEVKKVSNQESFREVGDTAVRENIYYWLEKGIERVGYHWVNDFEYSSY